MNYTVCKGFLKPTGDIVLPQITEHLMKPDFLCSRILGFCSNPSWSVIDSSADINRILSDKPEFLKGNDYVNKQYEKLDKKSKDAINALHITDIHVDLNYTEGMNANCGDPICCRQANGYPKNQKDAAGKYGSYTCDLAPSVLNIFFNYIDELPMQPDVIFWTGDNTAHDVWLQSVEENAYYTHVLTDRVKEIFPDTPVYPVLGNHEFFPVNVQRFDGVHPVIDKIAEDWAEWLGEGIDDFKNFGYYNIPMQGKNEDWTGYRVIALNTAVCNTQNWYLSTQNNDPTNHLKWLEEQLVEIEKNDEKAYILGHVIPGSGSCSTEWSIRYRALMERYQHLVITHLFGHVHKEDFNLVTDSTNSTGISVINIPGGVNSNGDKNPTFRMYEVDRATRYPLRANKHFFNVTRANEEFELNGSKPNFEFAYEYTEEYGMNDFSPGSFQALAESFEFDSEIATRFVQSKSKC